MLKFQMVLIAILIACFAFVSCERAQQIMTPVTDDMMTEKEDVTPETPETPETPDADAGAGNGADANGGAADDGDANGGDAQ